MAFFRSDNGRIETPCSSGVALEIRASSSMLPPVATYASTSKPSSSDAESKAGDVLVEERADSRRAVRPVLELLRQPDGPDSERFDQSQGVLVDEGDLEAPPPRSAMIHDRWSKGRRLRAAQ